MNSPQNNPGAVAIIGMAGRFPKARNLDEFWHNLCNGVDGISFFTEEELAPGAGAFRDQPGYVKAHGVLEGAEWFDAGFFGINPREAELMDPQQRVFLECAWEALENAGCTPEKFNGEIGVFGGLSMNTYLAHNLASRPELTLKGGELLAMTGNDKDYLTTRVSYKLNLRGPSMNIQTACSTSLVAVCVACQNLLACECDVALAGAVSISFPQKRGYLSEDGGIASPDGHCRPFDAKAAGTVSGEGVGIVVLKRLDEALADGDEIHAVIRGYAVNNDGSMKIGFTAPSVEGQAEVIRLAQAMAGFPPETIGYVEAHGTGTSLGDPIEIEGLNEAFRAGTAAKHFCALGSVKGHIGHLDTAAGVTGLIKTVLMLRHKKILPTLHFESPNPKIDFANSPFYVNPKLREWPADGAPRRAGVSSFGIGGTNAHVVLEEAPAMPRAGERHAAQLLVLSARTRPALDQMTANLAAHLRQNPGLNLADVAGTLQLGRREFDQRLALACSGVDEAAAALEGCDPRRPLKGTVRNANPPVVFMFPGQGAQQVNMGRELYRQEAVFRKEVDRCCEILLPHLDLDLRAQLYPGASDPADTGQLAQTSLAQPALFVVEYALARLWMSWGLQPEAMIGHSIGEYVAATLAGVFSLEDALALVAARGRLMQNLPAGSMLAVRLSEAELMPLLPDGISLSAVNSANLCVVSGTPGGVAVFQAALEQRDVACTLLHTSHAFHSPMMEPVLPAFAALAQCFTRHAPRIPFISNVTGAWITAEQATDPAYWANHLRGTVRFADGLGGLLRVPERIFLEIGPGQTLCGLLRQHPGGARATAVSSLRRAGEGDVEIMLNALGRLWLEGVRVDWRGFQAQERRHRVGLPAYPFERKRYFIEPARNGTASPAMPGWDNIPRDNIAAEAEPAGPSPVPITIIAAGGHTRRHLVPALKDLLAGLSGRDLADVDGATFVEMGFDSLLLAQLSLAIEKKFKAKVTFRQLQEQFSTFETLAAHLESTGTKTGGQTFPALEPAHGGRAGQADLPVTAAQKEIWFASQMGDQASCAYNEVRRLHFQGELNAAALQTAVQMLVNRHEALRTIFSPRGDRQYVLPRVDMRLALDDLSALDADRQDARLKMLEAAESGTAFDLVAGPLVRVRLARLAADRSVLLLTAHHIICDGGAWNVLLQELGALYSAECREIPAHLGPAVKWSDFALTESKRQTGSNSAKAENFWLRQFPDGAPVLELPTDHPRPAAWTFTGARESGVIGPSLTQRVRQAGARRDCTLFITLLAAYYVFLRRLTGQEDIVLGIPMMDATRAKRGAFIGHAVNLLPFRMRVTGNPAFLECLAAVKKICLAAYEHQDCAFGNLVQKLNLPHDPSRMPLTSITFNVDRLETPPDFSGLKIRPSLGRATFCNFDLYFNVTEAAEGLELDCRYNPSLFSAETIRRWLRDFETLLENIAADPAFVFPAAPSLTPIGEANPRSLSSSNAARTGLDDASAPPHTPTEEILAEIWRDVLRLEQVGRNDKFFDLGGHSLLMTQVISRVGERFQVELPMRRFFESPTVAGLAAVIEELLVEDISRMGAEEAGRLAHSPG